jgi:hypothetical protein
MGMAHALLEDAPCFLRQRMLGSEAVYRVISEDGPTVMAEVVEAPGLERGTRLRLMARAVRAMERLDSTTEPIAITRRFAPAIAAR